ncbi:MAG: glycosyltransferase family 39 protein [Clostridia bacterium]|nr:glycosyltransferase family 39 protein [Clostridia bacterium]
MGKIKEKYGSIIESGLIFILFTLIVTLWMNTSRTLNYDLTWCFHISQKVANGDLLYSEISTVVTPLYFWFGAIFIKIFGNSLISMNIFGGVVWGIIATTLYNILKITVDKRNYLFLPLFAIFLLRYSAVISMTNYNSFAVMWWLIAIFLEIKRELNEKDNKEILYNVSIGLVLGITFFSKQNIGFFAVVTTGAISIFKWILNKKNTIKEILSKMLGFFVVMLVMLIYFIFTNTFSFFIDFCFGGLLEFGTENVKHKFIVKYVALAVILTLAIITAIKKKDKILMIEVMAQIAFCGLSYPLPNDYHVILSLLMSILIIMRIINYTLEKEGIYFLTVILFLIWAITSSYFDSNYPRIFFEDMMMGERIGGELYGAILMLLIMNVGLGIAFEKIGKCKVVTYILLVLVIASNVYIYSEIRKTEYIAKGLEEYQNLGLTKEQLGYIEKIIEYIFEKEAEGYNVYVISADASYYMLALERNNYKFDLTLYGSLGSKGEEGLIEDVSKLENAILLKNEDLMHQEPVGFDTYIKQNYSVIDRVGMMNVYGQMGRRNLSIKQIKSFFKKVLTR